MLRILSYVLLISAVSGQPVFDVASVRSSHSGSVKESRREKYETNPGTLNLRNVSLKSAIRWAYKVMEYQVSGPDWMGSERFDIAAKASEAVPEEQLRLMLQALLAERFKLTLHKETKDVSVYVLLVAKGGPKFHESQLSDGEPVVNADKNRMNVEVNGVTADMFVEMLSNILHVPVINQTGLAGRYDAKINISKYMPDGSAPFDPVATILTGLQEELGLKLESKKMPLDLLVVDHAEKVPVEN